MSKFWSEITKKVDPYIPGEQPKDKKYIKLNTNENPYAPSPNVINSIKSAAAESLRLYPDPECDELRKTIGEYYNIKKEQIFIGNGSDEVLAFAFMAFFNPGSTIFFADITYSFYVVYANLFNIKYELIPLDNEFFLPVEKLLKPNNGIIIANPNAPTGKYIELNDIKRILDHNKESVVIIDEAYIDFGGESAVGLINEYPNLLVIQTFSKSRALAGMRIGFAMGHEDLIEGLNRIKNSINSYTLDRLALIAGIEAVKDDAYFKDSSAKIVKTRERITRDLINKGFEVVPSMANFIFIRHPDFNAFDLFVNLREMGILVRYFNKPRINEYLRVSIGTDEDMDCFLSNILGII